MTLITERIFLSLAEAPQPSQDAVVATGLLHSKRVMTLASNTRYTQHNNNNNNNKCKNKGDTSNNRGDWDYFKVIQKIREQHTRKM